MLEFVSRRTVALVTALAFTLPAASVFAAEPSDADIVEEVTVEITSDGADEDGTALVGITQCDKMLGNESNVAVTWTFTSAIDATVIRNLALFSVERGAGGTITCENNPECTTLSDDDASASGNTVTLTIPFPDLLEGAASETTCEGFNREIFVRLTVPQVIGVVDEDTNQNSDAKIIIDTVRPTAPSALEASASENSIDVEFTGSADSDIGRYVIYYSKNAFEGGQLPGDDLFQGGIGDSTSGSIDANLEGAGSTFVAVASEDETGNVSNLSGVVEARVVETSDFWEEYRAAGGSETGGCSTTSSPRSLWPALLLIGLVAGLGRRRRRKATFAAALLALALLAPATASAESPTMGAFELKLGSYYPAIDDEFTGTGPFETIFGTKNLIVGELEVDFWLWQRFGKFGLGGHIGFSRVKGTALTDEASEVEEETRFSILPLRASAIYRFDWLAQNTKVPLSASVKAGLDWYRWRVAESDGDLADYDGDPGAGWKSGWHFAGNLQLLLDFLDESTAAAFDLNWGVNNSYLFVEYMLTRIDGFGAEGFDLSDDIWMLGLSFEF